MANEFTTVVHNAAEYREAVKHANALGFEVSNVAANGEWEAKDGASVFIAGSDIEVTDVGYKYIYAFIDGEETGIQPGPPSQFKDAGSLRLTFSEV